MDLDILFLLIPSPTLGVALAGVTSAHEPSPQHSIFFKKMGPPWPLFRLFSYFQTNITILTTNECEKCPCSIRCLDLNSRPSEHESPPITTRPRLPPYFNCFVFFCCFFKWANPGPFFFYFRSPSNKHYYNFYNRLM